MTIRDFKSRGLFLLLSLCAVAMLVACNKGGGNEIVEPFEEKVQQTIHFTNAEVYYMGDQGGDGVSDSWLVRLHTDMESDASGNFVGAGSVLQLLLNVTYNKSQQPNLAYLESKYSAQSNTGDFSPNTFIYGYIDYVDHPSGRQERPDATFYASIAEGSTDMNIDLIDDGSLQIVATANGLYSISGEVVGKQCRKRKFEWSGEIKPKSQVVETTPNSLLKANLNLDNLTQALLQDRGDYFYLRDESYRDFLLFLADDSVVFEWGKPQGSGNVLRLELLVPWEADVKDGVPAGVYSVLLRNADTSLDREAIAPFHAVSGLPDRFSYPYWAGSWYVKFTEGAWGDSYARIDGGTVTIERGEDGSHRVICNLQDCSIPSYAITTDTTISKDRLTIY